MSLRGTTSTSNEGAHQKRYIGLEQKTLSWSIMMLSQFFSGNINSLEITEFYKLVEILKNPLVEASLRFANPLVERF